MNGKPLTSLDALEISHHDRVLFGTSHLFAFSFPQQREALKKQGMKFKPPTYDESQARWVSCMPLVTRCSKRSQRTQALALAASPATT